MARSTTLADFRLTGTEPHGLTITIRLPVSYATEEAA